MKKILATALMLALAASIAGIESAEAAKKKPKPLKRSDFTAEQRAKIMDNARKICRQKYGAPASVAKVDYYTRKVWCWTS